MLNFIKKIKNIISKYHISSDQKIDGLVQHGQMSTMNSNYLKKLDEIKILTGRMLSNQISNNSQVASIHDAEFQVFSQYGDDGIIQYLIHNVNIENQVFIEFGVESYQEANTRFLLINNHWNGLVIDSSETHITSIKKSYVYHKYGLEAFCSFITSDNINQLIRKYIDDYKLDESIGILSIDIDGNDYWIWKSISIVDPEIVIIEFNSHFGYKFAITVPYSPNFNREKAHHSRQYWGASLRALDILAKSKGYQLVGCCRGGNNAYFVKSSKLGSVKPLSVEEAYVKAQFRDSLDQNGIPNFLDFQQRLFEIKDLPVVDIEKNITLPLKAFGSLF